MCEDGHWEPFTVIEREKSEPLHRCYQRCTVTGCTDIRVELFSESDIEVFGGGIDSFNDPTIVDKGDEDFDKYTTQEQE